MSYGITDLPTFILGTIAIVLLPGPNSLYVMSVASRSGVAMGYRGACGIFVGDAILMTLSAGGAASLLRTTPALFMVLKYAGAAYLAWIGLKLLRHAFALWRKRNDGGGDGEPSALPRPDERRPFRVALAISLMNPKAILFFVSFFIQFVDPRYAHPELSFLLLGLVVQACSAAYLSMLIFAGARLARQFHRRKKLAAAGTAGAGGLFLGFGAKLASATLG